MGKIWVEKKVNREAFKLVLSKFFGGVKFKELYDSLWPFEFLDGMDKGYGW